MSQNEKISTYDLCRAIRKRIVNKAAELMAYGCDAEFAIKEIKLVEENLITADGFYRVDPSDLTDEQLNELGFGLWSDETPMRLIPLWLLPFLVDDLQCGSISDYKIETIKRSAIDNDHRFGCLAFGVIPCDKQHPLTH